MKQWKDHISTGNKHFDCHEFDKAEIHYLKAKQIAESLFGKWLDPQEAVAALVVSYHNLADLYSAENQYAMAFDMLTKVHSLLLKAIDFSAADNERQIAIRAGARRTYSTLLHHMKVYDQVNHLTSGNESRNPIS